MQRSQLFLAGLVLSSLFQVPQTCSGEEYWGQIGTAVALNERWGLKVEESLKVRGDDGQLFKHNSNGELIYSGLAKGLDVSVGFRRLYEKDGDGQWDTEDRPHLNLQIKTDICGVQVSNRSRVEYRLLDDREDYWRYRNMTQVKFPSVGTAWHLRPSLAVEPHFDIDQGGFKKNRSYIGVSADITNKLSGTVYYLLETSKSDGHWHSVNVLGTSLVFHLG